jgi:hypothetical protein
MASGRYRCIPSIARIAKPEGVSNSTCIIPRFLNSAVNLAKWSEQDYTRKKRKKTNHPFTFQALIRQRP